MNIELVSKKVEWVVGEGVRTTIKVQASVPHFSGLGKMKSITHKHEIYIQPGESTDNPQVLLKVGSVERDKWVAALHDWLATTDYIEEWKEEAAKYRHVVSQVDLPANAATWPGHIAYESHGVDKDPHALTYKLMIGEVGFFISVVVMAKYEGAVAYIGLQEPDEYYLEYNTSYIKVDEVPLSYPITVNSMKAAVGPAVDDFLSKVGQLVGEPLVEQPPPEGFYDI